MPFLIVQVGLLNVDGYYNSLLSFIDTAVEEGFISPSARHIIVSAPTAKELVKKMEVFRNPSSSILFGLVYMNHNHVINTQFGVLEPT